MRKIKIDHHKRKVIRHYLKQVPREGIYKLRYTHHAYEEAEYDEWGNIKDKLPYTLDVSKAKVESLKVEDRSTQTWVYVIDWDKYLDLGLAVKKNGHEALRVITVFLREKDFTRINKKEAL